MKYTYRLIGATLLFFINYSFVCAFESSRGEVEFNIRFFDRRIYHVQTDPIFVQVTITNNSPYPYRFKLADDRSFSIDFDIRTMTNRQLPQADSLVRKRTQNAQVFFREITIESFESFSFIEDLRDYVIFSQTGSFRVRARVYPELIRAVPAAGQAVIPALESNFLNLSLRPPIIHGSDGIPLEMDVATGALLVRQQLPPDEVVTYMLLARQTSQWERFFLYLDLETMLTKDAYQRRRWLSENEEGRRKMLLQYRQTLQNPAIDDDLSVIPTTFEILRTVYNNNEGTVTALLKFRMPTYTQLRQYIYYLEKKDNYWMIVNYTVQGLGTEDNR